MKFDAQQNQITDYIKIASAVDKVVHNNPLVSSLIKENNKHTHTREFSTPLLQQLFVNAQNNSKHLPKQKRHAEVIKKFSMSVLFMAGPSAYDLIHQNMPDALPSLSTIRKEMRKSYSDLVEDNSDLISFQIIWIHINVHG